MDGGKYTIGCGFMGLMRLILGFDSRDYYELKERVERLEERIGKLEELNSNLRSLASEQAAVIELLKSELSEANDTIEALEAEVGLLRSRLEEIEAWMKEREHVEVNPDSDMDGDEYRGADLHGPAGGVEAGGDEEAERIVLEAIRNGVSSPSEIISATGLNKHRVYAVLKKLSDEGLLEKRRDGRRVRYSIKIPVEN